MPVTLKVAPHPAKGYTKVQNPEEETPFGILQRVDSNGVGPRGKNNQATLIQSSVTPEDAIRMVPRSNGFVDTCVTAYNNHHNLVLRPDDVWFAILCQFSFYVNGHAEEMRDFFVEHQGKKELVGRSGGNSFSVDWGRIAEAWSHMIKQNVKDPSIHSWIVPSFSTTTVKDKAIASILMMSTVKAYFSYRWELCCGIPTVTLLGEKSDWELLLDKIGKFSTVYNKDHRHPRLEDFEGLLTPVLERFVETFDAAKDPPVEEKSRDFWSKICHYLGGGSGPTYLTGWITAFCAFDKDGKWQAVNDSERRWITGRRLELDGVVFPLIDTKDVPQGWAEVDVTINDNGREFDGKMVAGLIGTIASASGDEGNETHEQRPAGHPDSELRVLGDTLAPYSAWFMVEKGPERAEEEDPRFRGFGYI